MLFATILKTTSQLRGSDKSPIQNDGEEPDKDTILFSCTIYD